jgi:peptidoglycan/xylan/chitin deacetylase (PgdA/CDA1 family)
MSRDLILGIAKWTGLFAVAGLLTRKRLRILGYHGIWFLDGHFGNHLFMNPEKFRARMAWLKNSKYAVMPLGQAISKLGDTGLPAYSTVITIDDGWYGTCSHMLPVLEEFALPATLYVYTQAVEAREPLQKILLAALIYLTEEKELEIIDPVAGHRIRWDLGSSEGRAECTAKVQDILFSLTDNQTGDFCRLVADRLGFDYERISASRQFGFMSYEHIAEADSRGLDIQLHTHTHELDADQPETIEREIAANREALAPHVTSPLEHFCYPCGIHSPGMFPYLERHGIRSAVLTDTGLVTRHSHRYTLRRIMDGEDISLLEFEAELCGFLELVRGAKQFLNNGMASVGLRRTAQ